MSTTGTRYDFRYYLIIGCFGVLSAAARYEEPADTALTEANADGCHDRAAAR